MEWWSGLIVGVAGVIVTLLGIYFTFRGKLGENANARKQVESSAIQKALEGNIELNRYIDEKIDAAVKAAVAPLQRDLDELRSEQHEILEAVRTRETQLWIWDQRGRQGRVPDLPAQLVDRLGLGHLAADGN